MSTFYKITGAPDGTLLRMKMLFGGRITVTIHDDHGDVVAHGTGDDKHEFQIVAQNLLVLPDVRMQYGRKLAIGDKLTPGENQQMELRDILKNHKRWDTSDITTRAAITNLFSTGVLS